MCIDFIIKCDKVEMIKHDFYITHLKYKILSQHKVIPGNLEASDETLEREAGSDMSKVWVFYTWPTSAVKYVVKYSP